MKVTAIFGGPGTGKTTKLAELFCEAIKKYGVDQVAFVSYTKSQVGRDKTAARKMAKVKAKKLKKFKTLHSLSKQVYEEETEVFDEEHIDRMSVYLGKDMGAVMRGIDYMRNVESRNDAVGANKAGMQVEEFQKYKYFYDQVKDGLSNSAKKTVDFSDMIYDAVDRRYKVDVKIAFVDECQDLSPLQWKAIYTFFRDVDELVVAGDPNQALYRFSGGVSNYMLYMRTDETVILDKSYRCPENIMLMAERVWAKIKDKAALPSPCGEGGFAVFYPDFNIRESFLGPLRNCAQKGKKVLVLANTYYQLKNMKDRLFGDRNYPHSFRSGKCKYRYKGPANPIVFSTVHQAKGLEADYVLYDAAGGQTGEHTDFGHQTERWDDYWRMAYTAITRARKGLIICELSRPRAGEPTCLDLLYYAKYGFDEYRKWLYLKPLSSQGNKR